MKQISTKEYWDLLDRVLKTKSEMGALDIPIQILGHPGFGKTAIPQQVAEHNGKNCVILPVAQFSETGDLLGMPDIKDGKTVYLPIDTFPTDLIGGLIVIDDFNRANSLIIQSLLHFIQFGEFGSYKKPDNYKIVLTGNLADQDYNVNEVDNALDTRGLKYEVTFDKIQWGKWARKNGIDEKYISFVLKNGEFVNKKDNIRAFTNGFSQLSGCEDLDWVQFIMAGAVGCYIQVRTWLEKEWTELKFDSNDIFDTKKHKGLIKIFKECKEDGKTLFSERLLTLNVSDLKKDKIKSLQKFFIEMKKVDEERFMIAYIPINKECPDVSNDCDFLFESLV
jgi:hypothetical protein